MRRKSLRKPKLLQRLYAEARQVSRRQLQSFGGLPEKEFGRGVLYGKLRPFEERKGLRNLTVIN